MTGEEEWGVSRLGDTVKPGWEYKEGEFTFRHGHFGNMNYWAEDSQIQWVRTEVKKLLVEAGMLGWPTGHPPTTCNFYIQESLSIHSPHSQIKCFSCLVVATQSSTTNDHILNLIL